jgi:hypothetical protein
MSLPLMSLSAFHSSQRPLKKRVRLNSELVQKVLKEKVQLGAEGNAATGGYGKEMNEF